MSRKRDTTRQLMGIDALTGYSIATPNGELVYYIISPTNLGVLPESSITARVQALLGVLRSQFEVEMLALNSCEDFDFNKSFYKFRADLEPLPAIRALLEQDSRHLDNIQTTLSTAREFFLVVRLREPPGTDILRYLSTLEQRIRNHGFTARRASRSDLMRMLGIYYAQIVASEGLEEYDGQRYGWPEKEEEDGKTNEKPPTKKKNQRGSAQKSRRKKKRFP